MLSKEEAKEYFTKAFEKILPFGVKIVSVDWERYSDDVTIVAGKEELGPLPASYPPLTKVPPEEPL